jgi:hypothetical protein
MKRALAIVGLCVLLIALAGCGSGRDDAAPRTYPGRSVLYAGVGNLGPRRPVSDEQAKHDVRYQLRSWAGMVAKYGGGGLPVALTRRQFRQRLTAAAAQYHFTVKRLRFFHSRALAPLVVIETRHYVALAQATRLFIKSLNPQVGAEARPPCTRKWGNSSSCAPPELMFLEAQDERGVPFFAVGTGQWARSEELYPFPHG